MSSEYTYFVGASRSQSLSGGMRGGCNFGGHATEELKPAFVSVRIGLVVEIDPARLVTPWWKMMLPGGEGALVLKI